MYMAEMHILWVELVQFILLVSLSETAMHLSRLFRRVNPHFSHNTNHVLELEV